MDHRDLPRGAAHDNQIHYTSHAKASAVTASVCLTIASAPACNLKAQCFLKGHFFQQASTGESICVENLQKGDVLNGPDGEATVEHIIRHQEYERDIVNIQTEDGIFSVTADHGLVVFDESGEKRVRAAAELLPGGFICTDVGQKKHYKAQKETKSIEAFEVHFTDDRSVFMVHPTHLAIAKGGPGESFFGYGSAFGHLDSPSATGKHARSAPASVSHDQLHSPPLMPVGSFTEVRLTGREKDGPTVRDVLYKLSTEADCVNLLHEGLRPDKEESLCVAIMRSEIAAELEQRVGAAYLRCCKSQSKKKGRRSKLAWKPIPPPQRR